MPAGDTEQTSTGCCPLPGLSLFDAKKRTKTARYLYNDIWHIKALFGFLDGLIISYSTFKLIFDYITPPDSSASDAMHNWMNEASGSRVATAELIAIIAFSMVGNVFDEKDPNPVIRKMAWFWPYFRDAFKGLKFAYKGLKSTLFIAQELGVDLNSMLVPVGLVLGIAAAANRIYYRNYVTEPRKNFQKKNERLLRMAQNLGMSAHYALCDMVTSDDDIKAGSIYLHIDEENNTLTYKVLNPYHELVTGTIKLKEALLYKPLINNEGNRTVCTVEHLNEFYCPQIYAITINNGHTANHFNNTTERCKIRAEMDKQELPERWKAMASAFFSGFVDGLYTYMGAMGLALLAPSLFAAMAACCTLFTVLCMMNRCHEENEFQKDFLRSRMNVELVLLAKEIEERALELQKLSEVRAMSSQGSEEEKAAIARGHEIDDLLVLPGGIQPAIDELASQLKRIVESQESTKDSPMNSEHLACEDRIRRLMARKEGKGDPSLLTLFYKKKHEYNAMMQLSTQRAILTGLRSGLYCYSAICSVLFAFNALSVVALITFPPILLVGGIIAGILSLLYCVCRAIQDNHVLLETAEKNKVDDSATTLFDLMKRVKRTWAQGGTINLASSVYQDALIDGLQMDPLLQYHVQEAGEAIRSFFSGASKGQRGFDFPFDGLMEQDAQGHYHDTPITILLGLICSVLYAIVYGLRAFAKNFRGANDVSLPNPERVQKPQQRPSERFTPHERPSIRPSPPAFSLSSPPTFALPSTPRTPHAFSNSPFSFHNKNTTPPRCPPTHNKTTATETTASPVKDNWFLRTFPRLRKVVSVLDFQSTSPPAETREFNVTPS